MGRFLDPVEMKSMGTVDYVQQLDNDQLDRLLIKPAERAIELEYGLDLDTDDQPRHWAGTFETRPDLLAAFTQDMRDAVVFQVNRMAQNPHGFGSQSVGGSSAQFGRTIPLEVDDLMERWRGNRRKRIFRA
jgi:hypothetical protein